MDKKVYLLKLLDSLKDIRPLAGEFEILVNEGNLTDELIDVLLTAIKESIHEVSDELAKEKLQKGANFLQQMKRIEAEKNAEDEADLAKLDNLLDQM